MSVCVCVCVSQRIELILKLYLLPMFHFWTFKTSRSVGSKRSMRDEFQSGVTGERWQLDRRRTLSASFETRHIKKTKKTPSLFKSLTSLLYHIEHFRWTLVPTFKHIPKRRTLTEMAFLLLLFFNSSFTFLYQWNFSCVVFKGKIHLKTAGFQWFPLLIPGNKWPKSPWCQIFPAAQKDLKAANVSVI